MEVEGATEEQEEEEEKGREGKGREGGSTTTTKPLLACMCLFQAFFGLQQLFSVRFKLLSNLRL